MLTLGACSVEGASVEMEDGNYHMQFLRGNSLVGGWIRGVRGKENLWRARRRKTRQVSRQVVGDCLWKPQFDFASRKHRVWRKPKETRRSDNQIRKYWIEYDGFPLQPNQNDCTQSMTMLSVLG